MDCKGFECINSYGSYRCECDIGHRLEGDHCVGTSKKKKILTIKIYRTDITVCMGISKERRFVLVYGIAEI